MHALDRRRAPFLRDRDRLNHRLQLLLTHKLQHLKHLRPRPNMAASHLTPIRRERLRLDLREGRVGQANMVHFAVDGQGGQVGGHVELVCGVGGVEHEVEGEGPGFGPV